MTSKTPTGTPGPSPHTTQFSSPVHQFNSATPNFASPTHKLGSPGDAQTSNRNQNNQPTTTRPDYSRTHFQQTQPPKQPHKMPGQTDDIFADILGQQGYRFGSKTTQGPRSINEMRKEELVKDMDPDKLKILEWVKIL